MPHDARTKRAVAFGSGVALAVFAASLVGLSVAFPTPHGLLADFLAFHRQAWLLVACSLFAGLGLGALVQTRLIVVGKKKGGV